MTIQCGGKPAQCEKIFRMPYDDVSNEARAGRDPASRPAEQYFRELAETIEDVFWVTDAAKNQILYVSPAYDRIWGRSRQSLYDEPRSWLEGIHPEDQERVRHAVTARQVSGEYDEVYRIVRPDRQVRWIRDRAFPVRNASGQVERLVGIARDITELLQMTEQIRHSQKMEAVGQLAGGVAHDFNNLLVAIILQAELTASVDHLPAEAQEGLRNIRDVAGRAGNLVRQLLLFSRKQMMQARNLDLNEVVTNLAKMIQRIIGEGIHLQLHLHPAPLIVHADAAMLDQVLMNLAVNARDAMPGGGPLLIQTTERRVDESLTLLQPDIGPGMYAGLIVTDAGTGIEPEILPRVFEPFFTTKEPGKGTGLGLATVFGIARQHGGFVEVDSEPGRGSSFRVFLPVSKASYETQTCPESVKPCGGTETILLVEDDESVRSSLLKTLQRHGYRVLAAPNGVQALKLWEKNQSSVALLLTDLVMPAGVSGQELASRLQQDKPQLKVVFTSGYSAEMAGRQLELHPGESFLQKPFPPRQLLETIRQCLD